MNFSKLLSWIPGWLGFLLLILVGVAMTINGIANTGLDPSNKVGFIVFGISAILIGTFSWIVAARSRISGRSGKVGVLVDVQDMPWWGWLVDIGILVISVVIYLAAK